MPLFIGDSNLKYINAFDYPTMLYKKPKTLEEVRDLYRAMENSGHQYNPDDHWQFMDCFEQALRNGSITMVLLNSLKEAVDYALKIVDAKGLDIHEISLMAHYEAVIADHLRQARIAAESGAHQKVVKNMDLVMDYLERYTDCSLEVKELFTV